MTFPLTKRQQAILEAIKDFHSVHGYSPSLREIISLTGGTMSTSVVSYNLRRLREQGVLAFEDGQTRTVRLT